MNKIDKILIIITLLIIIPSIFTQILAVQGIFIFLIRFFLDFKVIICFFLENNLIKQLTNDFGSKNILEAKEHTRKLIKSVILHDQNGRNAAISRLTGDAVNMAAGFVLNPNNNIDPQIKAKLSDTLMGYAAKQLFKNL